MNIEELLESQTHSGAVLCNQPKTDEDTQGNVMSDVEFESDDDENQDACDAYKMKEDSLIDGDNDDDDAEVLVDLPVGMRDGDLPDAGNESPLDRTPDDVMHSRLQDFIDDFSVPQEGEAPVADGEKAAQDLELAKDVADIENNLLEDGATIDTMYRDFDTGEGSCPTCGKTPCCCNECGEDVMLKESLAMLVFFAEAVNGGSDTPLGAVMKELSDVLSGEKK